MGKGEDVHEHIQAHIRAGYKGTVTVDDHDRCNVCAEQERLDALHKRADFLTRMELLWGDTADEPLTEHDVAERLDKAAERTLRILMDVRQTEGLYEPARRSRYHTNVLGLLAEELALWARPLEGETDGG